MCCRCAKTGVHLCAIAVGRIVYVNRVSSALVGTNLTNTFNNMGTTPWLWE
jgi:hypothetical protein